MNTSGGGINTSVASNRDELADAIRFVEERHSKAFGVYLTSGDG